MNKNQNQRLTKHPKLVFLGLLTLIFCSFSFLPTDFSTKIIAALKKYTDERPQEKVYLHLDKPYYMAGETMWFKAYLFDGINHGIDSVSRVLYVDLVDPSVGTVVATRKLYCQSGMSQGEIALPDSLSQNIYVLRAYTNYMKNYSDEWFFNKSVPIWQKKPNSQPTDASLAELADCQFFPEGGNMVADLDNRVAFKIVNKAGKGVQTDGFILENDRDTVAGFKALNVGMGFFMLKPKANATYTAKIKKPEGGELSVKLPTAIASGYVMNVDNMSSKTQIRLNIAIKTPQPNSKDSLLLLAHQRGVLCFAAKIPISKSLIRSVLPRSSIPSDGIVQITLFDPKGNPQCERLIFAQNNNQINLTVKADKATYAPREKVTLNLMATDSAGKPVEGIFSLAATDGGQVRLNPHDESLLSYLLLSSDLNGKDAVLRGGIENPAAYFDKNNRYAAAHLDILMMTHGWRKFVWREVLEEKTPKFAFLPEIGFAVKGKVARPNNKISKNVSVTLMFKNKVTGRPSLQMAVADEQGNFMFDGLQFFDSTQMFIQAVKESGGRNLDIKLDNLKNLPPSVAVTKIPFNTMVFDGKAFAEFLKKTSETLAFEKKLKESQEKMLQEVEIKASKTEKADPRRIYSKPRTSLEVKPDDCGRYATIFDFLQGRVPSLQVNQSMGEYSVSIRGGSSVSFFMDGIPTDISMAQTISPCDVEAIDVLRGPEASIFGSQGGDGVISILSRRGNPNYDWKNEEVEGVTIQTYIGYAITREFYAPQYDVSKPEHEFPDFRATLHWQPYLRTKADGTAVVSFFNSDARGSVDVVVDGIAKSGQIGGARLRYDVK